MKKKETTDLATPLVWPPSAVFEEMERFLNHRGWDMDRVWWPNMMGSVRVPAMDVKEEEERYVLTADLPGMSKEDVNIEVGEGVIEILAKKEQETEESREGYLRKERGSMYFHRRLVLPEDVDSEHIEAKLNEGVLELQLPKLVKSGPAKKKVDVQ